MRILLKHATFLNDLNNYYDIFIENDKIKDIDNRINIKDADFSFYLGGRIVTPPLFFISGSSIDIEDPLTLKEVIKNGVKAGYTTYIFQLKENIDIKEIKKIEHIFATNYIRGLFIGTQVEYKSNFIELKEDLPKIKQETKIGKEKDGSLVVWDTISYTEIPRIPYIVISMGKIILREGKTIFI